MVDVLDRANRNICVTLLRYIVEKLESSCGQVQFFARKKEGEKFEKNVYVIFQQEDFIFLLGIMNSV